MADEKSINEESGNSTGGFSTPKPDMVDETAIPTAYSNNSFVDLTNTDISVLFLNDISPMQGRRSVPVRVAFSHAGFVQMVRFLQRYADFLENVYGGQVPSLLTVDQELLRREINDLFDQRLTQDTEEKDVPK